ncbi:MAG: hypothetical protein A4S09_11695 [Proteobacteria bacterium SG_bin7]|nr:MAG: hypothetical protein A4S09_11695 [Proteobacteria bacterium SG_bin7]
MKYDSVILDLEGTMEIPGTMGVNPKSNGVVLQDGVLDGLKRLNSKFPLFIVSNCGTRMLERFLNFNEMRSFFRDWECLGNTGNGKTENIIDVVKRNNLKKAIYIGDSFPDAEAAQNAKVDYIHAAYGNDGWLTGAQNFETFKEIVDHLVNTTK